MTLNKDTRDALKVGDILTENNMELEVLQIWRENVRGRNCIFLSLEIKKHPLKWAKKRIIRYSGISNYYGMEIIKK